MSTKKLKNPTKIMVFGTFDGLHPGHIHFFNQAKKLASNPILIVSVARDKNVKKIKNNFPIFSERERVQLIKRSKIADRVVLSGLQNHIPHILREGPDIIALGYDQKAYVKNLKNELAHQGLHPRVVRLKPYRKNIYKNSLIKKRKNNESEGRLLNVADSSSKQKSRKKD